MFRMTYVTWCPRVSFVYYSFASRNIFTRAAIALKYCTHSLFIPSHKIVFSSFPYTHTHANIKYLIPIHKLDTHVFFTYIRIFYVMVLFLFGWRCRCRCLSEHLMPKETQRKYTQLRYAIVQLYSAIQIALWDI